MEGVFNLRALISVMAAVVPDYPASCCPEIIPDVSFHFLRESRVENSDSVENDFKRLKISIEIETLPNIKKLPSSNSSKTIAL